MAQRDKPVPQGRVRRTMPLAGFAARATGGRLVAGLRERTGDDGAVERFHERTAERYTELLGHSKGVLMKAGQILSMIDARALGTGGFYPFQKALARLQADAPPMHPLLVRQVLDEELGSAVRHFAEFCDQPIAAASVGQVHRAVLCDRREVVVKIQYPGVAQAKTTPTRSASTRHSLSGIRSPPPTLAHRVLNRAHDPRCGTRPPTRSTRQKSARALLRLSYRGDGRAPANSV
jgi:ABC1 atypical kinase-like domain